MRDKIIRIHWNTPMLLDDAIESDLSNTQGLYYITRLFGAKETSLYLGIATRDNTIRHRLRGHKSYWLPEYRGKIFVRIGSIEYTSSPIDLAIDHAESAILYDPAHQHLFPENISKRKSYSYSELFRVENTGDYFELLPTIRMHNQT